MPKFRKKPVVIEAWRLHPVNGIAQYEPPYWLLNAINEHKIVAYGDYLQIETLEGDMIANPGDWIIRGVKGEIYPCKPDIFEATYEEIV